MEVMVTTENNIAQRALDYHTKQQCSSQWSCFLSVFFGELVASAGEEDGSAFLRHIGSRMAAELPLADHQTLEAMEADINRRWQDMNWGEVALAAEGKSIRITHYAYPAPVGANETSISRNAVSAVLEGVYRGWLEAQGGEAGVPLQRVTASSHALEFVYGTPAAGSPADDSRGI